MITETGVWDNEESNNHIFSYYLAKYLADKVFENPNTPILDLGCGRGTYLRYFQDRGFSNLTGIEGFRLGNTEYKNIQIADLTKPLVYDDKGYVLSIMRGNILCLEVIEHIPDKYADILFDNIVKYYRESCKIVLSCAIPGQGGIGHVNCRNNLWVLLHMEKRGFKCNYQLSQYARDHVEEYCKYFKETILIFEHK